MAAHKADDEPSASFVDGDIAFFACPELPGCPQLRPEGVQLVRAASVPDADAW